jgi:hypothetical protein
MKKTLMTAAFIMTLASCKRQTIEEHSAEMAERYSGVPITDVRNLTCSDRGSSDKFCIANGKAYLCLEKRGTWGDYECVHMTNPTPLLENDR